MLTHEQISLVGTYILNIIDLKSLQIFSEVPILGNQQRITLSLNQNTDGYKVRVFGVKDGEIIEKFGDAKWVDGKLVFYFSEKEKCQYSIKTLATTVTMAKEAFRGFIMTFELEKIMYCLRCER